MTSPKTTSKKAPAVSELGNLSYEEARDQLEQVVRQLEQQSVSLETSMELWERGEALAKICEDWLTGARKKLSEAVAARKQDPA